MHLFRHSACDSFEVMLKSALSLYQSCHYVALHLSMFSTYCKRCKGTSLDKMTSNLNAITFK